ncbi:MAG: Gfo/Idh/MocA family protein [Christensenellales bacterium]|jgi:predicted dehydrogenase
MRRIRMALIGAGIWGESHANIYHEHKNVELVAVCDHSIHRANSLAQKYCIPFVYSDYKKMLVECDCDAVAVVTPDYLHCDIAIACANAKKHILIEKPLATTKQDVYAVYEAIKKSDVRAMVDLHNRWSPPFNGAKQVIDKGELGKPISAYFRLNDIVYVPTKMLSCASKSSILWFLGSHSLDTLCWLLMDDLEEVYAVKHEGKLSGMGVDAVDVYQSTLRFKNGTIAQMENGWVTPDGNPCINDIKCNLVFQNGKIDIDASNHSLVQLTTDKRVETVDILVRNHVFGRCEGFAFESIRSFIDCLIEDREFHVSLEDAANTSLGLLAIKESAERGIPIRTEQI